MEQLQNLLISYYKQHSYELKVAPWSRQYTDTPFPKYWELVYNILNNFNRDLRVVEVGCGLGDVTVIPCFLGYKSIKSFEKNNVIADFAKQRIKMLFNKENVIENSSFPTLQKYVSDILIVVNCAYKDLAETKEEYAKLMQQYYISAGLPRYFIMEVIDSSYTKDDPEFPKHIRFSFSEVQQMFPNYKIQSWETYKYPINKKSKTLYLIEKP